MATGNQLMDEIYDQFLICKICYEIYKRPKTLVCLHTFCSDCLEKHQDAELERSYRYMLYSRAISCPICRKKTELPSGGVRRLPDNFLVENLTDVVNRRKPSSETKHCEICKPSVGCRPHPATSKCLDCSKLLCKNCVELHKRTKVTESHSLFDIEVEKDIRCKTHHDEVVRFYCEPCEVCICVVCTFQEHKGHDVSSFSEGINKYSHSLDSLLDACRQRIAALKDQIHLIHKCEGEIKKNEQQIRDMAIDSISAIRKQERKMIKDLHSLYGKSTLEFIKSKAPIQESIETLQSTHNLTDIVLRDKSIELLLLKREIQEKIETLLQLQPESTPENLLREVRFVPGTLVLGYLNVGDQCDPKTSYTEDEMQKLLSLKHAGLQIADTQTDPTITKESATTMGKLAFGYDTEQPTQTDVVEVTDTGTLTVTVTSAVMVQSKSTYTMAVAETRDHQTMTYGPAMTRKKTQTERITHANQMTWTTKIRTSDQGVNVCLPISVPQKSQCTSASPSVKDCETMTPRTPTMRRKMQTEPIKQSDQTTATTELEVTDKCINTQSNTTCDRSTLTTKRNFTDQILDTKGLFSMCEKETCTPVKKMRTSSTFTDQISVTNRSTLTKQPSPCDKCIGTPVVLQYAQETNTPVIHSMDMGITARVPGTDAATGTRNIVLADTGSGEGLVDTCDKGTEPWQDIMSNKRSPSKENKENINTLNVCEKTMQNEKPKTKNKGVYTNFFNMVSRDTETEILETQSMSVATVQVDYNENGTNTPAIKMVDICTDVQDDKFVLKVPGFEQGSQTDVTLKHNISPLEKETITDKLCTFERETCTDQPELVHAGVMYESDSQSSSTMTDCISSNSQSTNTKVFEYEHKEVLTEIPTYDVKQTETITPLYQDSSANTDCIPMADSCHDAYRGILCNQETNTDPNVIVKLLVDFVSKESNTDVVGLESKGTSMDIVLKDTSSDAITAEVNTMGTNTLEITKQDAFSTMSSHVETKDSKVSTPHVDLVDSSCETIIESKEATTGTEQVTLEDRETSTDQVSTKSEMTNTNKIELVEQSIETIKQETTDTGSCAIQFYGENKETNTLAPDVVNTGVDAPILYTSSRGTGTPQVETSHTGTVTFVQTVEKATYMPSLITLDTGTETIQTETSDKKVSTENVENFDATTMTPIKKCLEKDTTMMSMVGVSDVQTETQRISTVDANTDAVHTDVTSSSTNTPQSDHQDCETNTEQVPTMTAETTTNHRVDTADATEGTEIVTMDKETAVDVGAPRDRSTMTFVDKHNVGVLKRPHTVTRGAGTMNVWTMSKGTSISLPQTKDTESMTEPKSCKDKGILSRPFGLTDQGTEMAHVVSKDAETSLPLAATESRGSSPVRGSIEDRGSSPVTTGCVDRESSPVLWATQDQVVEARPMVTENATSTIVVELCSTHTETIRSETAEKELSPIKELWMKETADVATDMPPVHLTHKESSPIPVPSSDVGMGTDTIECVDRESTPIRVPSDDKEVMVKADVNETCTNTTAVETLDKQTATRKTVMLNATTEMPQVSYSEKETLTTQLHMLHKFVATENTVTVDKQTGTFDITSEYRGLLDCVPPTTVCRGTSTVQVITDSKQTSPPPMVTSEKASSPVRVPTKDKATMAKKGEIIEPVDTFQGAGIQKRPSKPIFDSPKSSLEMIREESKESNSSSDEDAKHKGPGMLRSHSIGNIPFHLEKVPSPKRLTHKEAFFVPSLPRLGKPKLGGFSLERHIPPSSVLAKVEVATNTTEVTRASCGTSTPVVDKEDKAICTESVSVDSKMAECINKLKTVRQRLEQPQQPVYVTATSQPESSQFITCSTQSPTAVRPSPCLQAPSKLMTERLLECTAFPPLPLTRKFGPPPNSGSESSASDQEQSSPGKNRLARKQRLNINQLLRSASLPDNNPNPTPLTPLVRPKLQVQAIHRQVIPKLDDLVSDDGIKGGRSRHRPQRQRDKQADVNPLVSPKLLRHPPSVSTKGRHQSETSKPVRSRKGSSKQASTEGGVISSDILQQVIQASKEHEREGELTRGSQSLPPTPKLRSHKHLLLPKSPKSSSSSSSKVEDSESTDF